MPRGNFGGVTYTVSASVSIIEGGAQFFGHKSTDNLVGGFFVPKKFNDINTYLMK